MQIKQRQEREEQQKKQQQVREQEVECEQPKMRIAAAKRVECKVSVVLKLLVCANEELSESTSWTKWVEPLE